MQGDCNAGAHSWLTQLPCRQLACFTAKAFVPANALQRILFFCGETSYLWCQHCGCHSNMCKHMQSNVLTCDRFFGSAIAICVDACNELVFTSCKLSL